MDSVAADDDPDWRSYVGRTRHNYVKRYVDLARDENANYERLEAELENLRNANEQAWALHAYQDVLQVADSLWCSGGRFLDYRGHARDGITVLTRAVDAARMLQDQAREEVLLGHLGHPGATEMPEQYFLPGLVLEHPRGVDCPSQYRDAVARVSSIVEKPSSAAPERVRHLQDVLISVERPGLFVGVAQILEFRLQPVVVGMLIASKIDITLDVLVACPSDI